MNDDLISRSALKKKIEEVQYTQEFCIEHKIDYSVSMQMLGMVIDNAPTVEADVNCSHCDYFKFSKLFAENIAKLMADYNIETYDDLINVINQVKDELGGRE